MGAGHPNYSFLNYTVTAPEESSDKNLESYDAVETASTVEDQALLDYIAVSGETQLASAGLGCSLVARHNSLFLPSYQESPRCCST